MFEEPYRRHKSKTDDSFIFWDSYRFYQRLILAAVITLQIDPVKRMSIITPVIICFIIVYLLIKHTMKTKLFYFYEKVIQELKNLLIFNISFLLTDTLINIIYIFIQIDLNFYLGNELESPYLNALFWIIGLFQYIMLFF